MRQEIGFAGSVAVRRISAASPSKTWQIRNVLRRSFISGLIATWLAKVFSRMTGIPTLTSELRIRVRQGGGWTSYGVVSRRVVTNAGVAFLVDDWDNSAVDITAMNYHGCGTGAVAENVSDTGLGAECTTVLNPDSTRATGTKSQPTASQLQTVGTASFDGSAAVTEHGIFSQAATGGGTLWDRSVFAAINVGSGDSIQFTYTLTVNSGG